MTKTKLVRCPLSALSPQAAVQPINLAGKSSAKHKHAHTAGCTLLQHLPSLQQLECTATSSMAQPQALRVPAVGLGSRHLSTAQGHPSACSAHKPRFSMLCTPTVQPDRAAPSTALHTGNSDLLWKATVENQGQKNPSVVYSLTTSTTLFIQLSNGQNMPWERLGQQDRPCKEDVEKTEGSPDPQQKNRRCLAWYR